MDYHKYQNQSLLSYRPSTQQYEDIEEQEDHRRVLTNTSHVEQFSSNHFKNRPGVKGKFLFSDFDKYRNYMVQSIGSHDTGEILRNFRNHSDPRPQMQPFQQQQQMGKEEYVRHQENMAMAKNITSSNKKNLEVQQQPSYELQNFQTFQFQRDKVNQQLQKQQPYSADGHDDFKTYYYQKRPSQIEDEDRSQLDNSQVSDISQSALNKSQQQITLYEVNTIYFTKHRKFRQYFIDLINYKMKFDFQELTPSSFYYSPNERALHFTETVNNQNYNRIYLDSIIKTVYFEVEPESSGSPALNSPTDRGQKKVVFVAIKYYGQQHSKSTMLIEIENPEIIGIMRGIMEKRGQSIILYSHAKLIESNENSFDVGEKVGRKEKRAKRTQEDEQVDQQYSQYLQRGQEQSVQREQDHGHLYSKSRFKGKVEKSIVSMMQSQLQAEALAATLLNEQQLEALEKYRQQDELVREYQPDLQSFMVKQLLKNGFKRLNNTTLQGQDGYIYDIKDFEHKDDGFIYGPSLRVGKDENGRVTETKDTVRAAPGIYKQNQDGILYGPEGQRYGHKDKVVPKKLVILPPPGTNHGTQLSPVSTIPGKIQKSMATSIMNNTFDQVTKETVRNSLHESITTLQDGIVFIKYGMRDYFSGSKRRLFIDHSLTFICWTSNLTSINELKEKKEIKDMELREKKDKKDMELREKKEKEMKGKQEKKEKEMKGKQEKKEKKEKEMKGKQEKEVKGKQEKEVKEVKGKQQSEIKETPVKTKEIPLMASQLDQSLDASSSGRIQIDPKQFNQLKSSSIFNLKSKIELVDKSALDKSTIYLDQDGRMKETEEQNIVYELVGEKQQKINKLFEVSKIQQIINGRKTKNFKRFSTKSAERNENSFSIVFRDRTVDLEAVNAEDKSRFLNALIFVVKNIDFQKKRVSKSPRKSIVNNVSKG